MTVEEALKRSVVLTKPKIITPKDVYSGEVFERLNEGTFDLGGYEIVDFRKPEDKELIIPYGMNNSFPFRVEGTTSFTEANPRFIVQKRVRKRIVLDINPNAMGYAVTSAFNDFAELQKNKWYYTLQEPYIEEY